MKIGFQSASPGLNRLAANLKRPAQWLTVLRLRPPHGSCTPAPALSVRLKGRRRGTCCTAAAHLLLLALPLSPTHSKAAMPSSAIAVVASSASHAITTTPFLNPPHLKLCHDLLYLLDQLAPLFEPRYFRRHDHRWSSAELRARRGQS